MLVETQYLYHTISYTAIIIMSQQSLMTEEADVYDTIRFMTQGDTNTNHLMMMQRMTKLIQSDIDQLMSEMHSHGNDCDGLMQQRIAQHKKELLLYQTSIVNYQKQQSVIRTLVAMKHDDVPIVPKPIRKRKKAEIALRIDKKKAEIALRKQVINDEMLRRAPSER